MEFHNPLTMKTAFNTYAGTKVSSEEALNRLLNDEARLQMQIDTEGLHEAHISSMEGAIVERLWRKIDRPFYNVFPIVTELAEKVSLDIEWRQIKPLNFTPLSVRFPLGREPYGIRSFTIFTPLSSLMNCLSDGDPDFDPASDAKGFEFKTKVMQNHLDELRKKGLSVCCGQGECEKTGEPQYVSLTHKDLHEVARHVADKMQMKGIVVVSHLIIPGETKPRMMTDHLIQEDKLTSHQTVEEILTEWCESADPDQDSPRSHDVVRSRFIMRMYAFLSLLSQGNDLITPVLLSRDTDKYESADEMARKRMEERATRTKGRGFNIGEELNDQTERGERSPHYRRPHAAIIRCGKQWKERKLIIRAGSVVTPKHLADVPTGFLGPETQAEIDAPVVEQKPYFRPHIPKRMRFNVLRRDGFACRYCGLSPSNCEGVVLHADHIISVNDGGSTTEDNLIAACDCCNLGKWKDSLSPEEVQQFCDKFAFDNKHPKRIKRKRKAG